MSCVEIEEVQLEECRKSRKDEGVESRKGDKCPIRRNAQEGLQSEEFY